MIPERVGAVVNPRAGGGNAAALFDDLAACVPDAEVDARLTTGPDDVPDAAREQAAWADLLVVVGGDGTLREVAAALAEAESETPTFVVPAGRGNSSYRHLYGDAEWRAVARRLATGFATRPIELGRLESEPSIAETYFVLGFTAGLFRSALENAERFRSLPGPLAYVLATAQAAVVDDPVDVVVGGDDAVYRGSARLVAVGGGRYRGSDFELLPESRPGDGTLHAIVVEPAGVRGSVRLAAHARDGRLLEHDAVHYVVDEEITVRSAGGLPVELDGTVVPTALEEARLTVVPQAMRIAVPGS